MIACGYFPDGTADQSSRDLMKAHAASQMDVPPEQVELVSHLCVNADMTQTRELTIDELQKHKMASNCAPNFDLSNVTVHNRYRCQYYGLRQDEHGNEGYNLSDTFAGTLASCDSGENDQSTYEDIRKLVGAQLSSSAIDLDHSKIRCDIMSFPG